MAEQKPNSKLTDEGLWYGDIVAERLVVPDDSKKAAYFEVDAMMTHRIDPINGKEIKAERPFKRSALVYITENTMEQLPDKLAALGFFGTLEQLDPTSKKHISVVGNRGKFLNKHDTPKDGKHAGKTFDRYQPFFTADVKKPESTAGAGRKLNMLFGDRFKPKAAPADHKPPTDQKPADPPADDSSDDSDDDETPF